MVSQTIRSTSSPNGFGRARQKSPCATSDLKFPPVLRDCNRVAPVFSNRHRLGSAVRLDSNLTHAGAHHHGNLNHEYGKASANV